MQKEMLVNAPSGSGYGYHSLAPGPGSWMTRRHTARSGPALNASADHPSEAPFSQAHALLSPHQRSVLRCHVRTTSRPLMSVMFQYSV